MTDVYVAVSQELLTIPASTVLFEIIEDSGDPPIEIISPPTESTKTMDLWLDYIQNEIDTDPTFNYPWNIYRLGEFIEIYWTTVTPSSCKCKYQPLGDATGFPFDFNSSTATKWGNFRCILQGAYDDTGYSKETSILNEINDEPIDMDIETIATSSYVVNTGYDKSEDLSIWSFVNKWTPSHKRQWIKDFIHSATFGKVDSEIILLIGLPEYVYKFFREASDDQKFKLHLEKTQRPTVDRFERGLIQYTLALLEVPQ